LRDFHCGLFHSLHASWTEGWKLLVGDYGLCYLQSTMVFGVKNL